MAAGASLAVLALARGPERWLGIGAEARGLDELAILLRAVAGLAALAAIATPIAVRRVRAGPS